MNLIGGCLKVLKWFVMGISREDSSHNFDYDNMTLLIRLKKIGENYSK